MIRRREKLKMKFFSLENRSKGAMMVMRQLSSGTERALLERGNLAVLPSGQGQTKSLVTT
jgi:hypothetical protein